MRFLLDQELSPAVAALLIDAGHDAVHLQGLGLSRAPDESVMARAVDDDRGPISADTESLGVWCRVLACPEEDFV